MDQNDLRTIVTVLGFLTFLGIVWWAWGRAQHDRFAEAADLPFTEDEEPNSVSRQAGALTKRKES